MITSGLQQSVIGCITAAAALSAVATSLAALAAARWRLCTLTWLQPSGTSQETCHCCQGSCGRRATSPCTGSAGSTAQNRAGGWPHQTSALAPRYQGARRVPMPGVASGR